TGHTQILHDKVLRYELDGAFNGSECNHPELESYPAFEEEPVVVSAASVSDAEEAATKPILVYSTGSSYRETLEKWLRS
ncbi:LysR substrate-binding domain-containing protein, partial [Bacillus vallismortis]|nr:LysR substrate-binding domain-containing protein [Bacillus vallismortis]